MTTKQISLFSVGAALTVLVTLGFERPASADLIPLLLSVTGTSLTGYTWNYDCDLTVDQRIQTGDYFTIYDFQGYTPGSETNPAGWVFSAQKTGVTPSDVLPTDDPNEYNLTWKWTGATVPGEMDLGTFSAKSIYNTRRFTDFAGSATKNAGPATGTKISNVGVVEAPTAPNVPEPSTLPLIGGALLGSIGLIRRRWLRA